MRVVHYLNQFFSGIGGEDKADTPPLAREGSVGPGKPLQLALGSNAEIVGTVICGDGLFADRMEQTAPQVLALIQKFNPDMVIAGPAFNAGRYGLACGRVCADTNQFLGKPAITGMYKENAAVELYKNILMVPTAATSLGMKDALPLIARLALKLGSGEPLGPASVEGYYPRGQRINEKAEGSASSRALEILIARIKKQPFTSELPLPKYEKVPPPLPVKDPTHARIAVVTESGLVPVGNPDRLEWVRASKWFRYSIEGKDSINAKEYEVIHSGYDAAHTLADPNRMVPVDALRELVRCGEIGELLDFYYVTCGNHGVLSQMARHAREIGTDLLQKGVNAVLLVAT
jgi:glycine reductase complex component B subunit gamma